MIKKNENEKLHDLKFHIFTEDEQVGKSALKKLMEFNLNTALWLGGTKQYGKSLFLEDIENNRVRYKLLKYFVKELQIDILSKLFKFKPKYYSLKNYLLITRVFTKWNESIQKEVDDLNTTISHGAKELNKVVSEWEKEVKNEMS